MTKFTGSYFSLCLFIIISGVVSAQDAGLQYFRSWDKKGINVFEPSKSDDQPEFSGFKFKIGASFTQDYQSLKHSNTPVYRPESADNAVNANLLYGTSSEDSTSATLSGFNTAMANLYMDAQIADGMRLCVESYMSSRHHNEFWVKGGYIQIDKLPMFGNPDWFRKYVRLKIGHFQPNYGDMQMRRTDGGNTMYNPFVENYILDAFTTEIGGEVYIFPMKELMLMGGLTGGTIHGNIDNPDSKPFYPFDKTPRKPSLFGKIAYDRTMNDFRFRLSASYYKNSGSPDQTLYFGDRAGSHYMMVMEPNRSGIYNEDGVLDKVDQSTYRNNKDSGKFIPFFRSQVTSSMVNAFLNYKGIKNLGIESFLTYETSKGRSWFEPGDAEREVSQFAGELVLRFGMEQNCFLGFRYNSFTGRPLFTPTDAKINRTTISAGWFPLSCMMIKAEYVTQEYKDFSAFDYRHDGKFDGFVLQATVGF